jgi:hypothetical protein
VPEDGKDHKIKCPSCGNESLVRKVAVADLPKDERAEA